MVVKPLRTPVEATARWRAAPSDRAIWNYKRTCVDLGVSAYPSRDKSTYLALNQPDRKPHSMRWLRGARPVLRVALKCSQ